jgi:hypothetical protein
MGAGTLQQLHAVNRQKTEHDYLTNNPKLSFFHSTFKRYINFAMEPIMQYFTESADFGRKTLCEISRAGDLLCDMYLVIQLPSIAPVGWVNGVGNRLIKSVELQIGGYRIDKISGELLDVLNELIVPLEKRATYYDMIGKLFTYGVGAHTEELLLYIPLPFWFCKNVAQSLPLISLAFAKVDVLVEFEELDKLWFKKNVGDPPNPFTTHITSAGILCTYAFLDDERRRDLIYQSPMELLIEQHQDNLPLCITSADTNIHYPIVLNMNVSQLIWFYKSDYATGINDVDNYANIVNAGQLTEKLVEPFLSVEFKIHGHDRVQLMPAKYYRSVQIYSHQYSAPNNFIYAYSFSINPRTFQPSGSCNFSRLDDVHMHFVMSNSITNGIIKMIAKNYNVLKIMNGMAGLFES